MWSKKDEKTGRMTFPKYDFVRLAIPRRVYTNSQMDYVASAFEEIKKNKCQTKGLRITYKTPWLTPITARMEEA